MTPVGRVTECGHPELAQDAGVRRCPRLDHKLWRGRRCAVVVRRFAPHGGQPASGSRRVDRCKTSAEGHRKNSSGGVSIPTPLVRRWVGGV